MADSITRWLEDLGLGKYGAVFAENEIGLAAVKHLSEDDLKELGLPMGPRKIVLAAIAELAQEGDVTVVPEAQGARGEAERRQIAVLFCDLEDSTGLSERLDPEDMREIVRRYQAEVGAAIERHGGFVANYLGDGIVACFGWPEAQEDQGMQAVRAGLEATAVTAAITVPDGGGALAARVGIATGQVVIGDAADDVIGRQGIMTGSTPSLAARLQGIAPPGGVIIEANTRALVHAAFDLDALGPQHLKGFDAPVDAWQVRAARAAESRFDERLEALTPFTGRAHEVGLLLDRWERAQGGEGQVVLISGEPGIGKSRIVQTFRDRIKDESHRRLRYQCSPFHVNTALYPIVQQMQHAAGIGASDDAKVRLNKLEAVLRQGTPDVAGMAPLIAALLSIPFEDRYGPLEMAPQQQRTATLRALQEQLLGLAAAEPVLFVLEDAHWIDPTTQDLIVDVVPRLTDRPVLMLITHRPEWPDPFESQGHVTTLGLTRLSRAQVAEMVRQLAGRHLQDDAVERIVERADGVPLFVEELTKSIVEAGFDVADSDVPVTLRDSLMARLDRLGTAKEIAQIGAAIGREFEHALLARVASIGGNELPEALDRLLRSQLVFRSRRTAAEVYTFKHALIQDVAYDSLLRQRRQTLHLVIAEALLERGDAGAAPEVLARHFERAGDCAQAMQWWERAGDAAAERSAQFEAAAHYENALKLLRAEAAYAGNDELEFSLLLRLGQAQIGALGGGSPATIATYDRAAALAAARDAPPEVRILVMYGQCTNQIVAGHFRDAVAIADQMSAIAEQHGAAWMRAVPERSKATALYMMGELGRARQILESVVASSESLSAEVPAGFAHDPILVVPAVLAHVEWALGDEATAFERSQRMVEKIGGLTNNPNSLSHVYIYNILLCASARDADRTRAGAELLRDHTQRTGGRFWELLSLIAMGAAHVLKGRPADGLPLLRAGTERWAAAGAQQHLPPWRVSLAEALFLLGEHAEALAVLDETRDIIERTEQRFYEPEMHRWRGLVLDATGRRDEALAALRQAVSVAAGQGSRIWQARAEADLAELLVENR